MLHKSIQLVQIDIGENLAREISDRHSARRVCVPGTNLLVRVCVCVCVCVCVAKLLITSLIKL